MYIFLEDKVLVPAKDVILIIEYIHITDEKNKEFYHKELERKELINLAEGYEKTVVITDKKIYISSYGTQTLMSRAKEFFNIIGGRKSEQ